MRRYVLHNGHAYLYRWPITVTAKLIIAIRGQTPYTILLSHVRKSINFAVRWMFHILAIGVKRNVNLC